MSDASTVTIGVEVKSYDARSGVVSWHENDEYVEVAVGEDGTIAIQANAAGLVGLARELLTLSQAAVPVGSEVYLMSRGQAPTLAEGSAPLLMVRR